MMTWRLLLDLSIERFYPATQYLLDVDFTTEDIFQCSIFCIQTKLPVEMGFMPFFFEKEGDVVGLSINFTLWIALSEINYTHVVLIPKKKKKTVPAANDRPSGLSNRVYKVASMTLTNKLQAHLSFVITTHQSVYIPSRLITESIVIAFELFNTIHLRSRGKNDTILNLSEAYD